MKKICILLLLFSVKTMLAQDYPENHPEILIGRTLTVKDGKAPKQYGYRNFYLDEALKKVYKKDNNNSKYAELLNKKFTVTDVLPYKNILGHDYFKIKMQDPEGKTVYYDYNPKVDYDYPFTVDGGLTIPDEYYCESLDIRKDKFTGEIEMYSRPLGGITFMRVKKDSIDAVFMLVNQTGITPNVHKKGLYILLENGKKLEKPNANIDVKVNEDGSNYVYSAFVELNKEDIDLLLSSKMTDKRLYIYDGTIEEGDKLIKYLKCITEQ